MEDFKQKLLQLIDWTYSEEKVLVEKLSEEERLVLGTLNKWSAKDLIAHTSFWKQKRMQDINNALCGKSPQKIENINEIIKEVFEGNKNRTWDDITNYSLDIYQNLIKTVSAASSNDLTNEQTYPWKMIIIYCCMHPIGHLDKYYVNRNQRFYSINLWKEIFEYLEKLPASPGILGTIKYNLASHYSISGDDFMATRILKESLILNPKLEKHAIEDPGLSSLL